MCGFTDGGKTQTSVGKSHFHRPSAKKTATTSAKITSGSRHPSQSHGEDSVTSAKGRESEQPIWPE